MTIKKRELKQLKDFYVRNGYLNIFIEGVEGVGKTSFGLQLLNKICKETSIEMSLKRVYYNLNKFLDSGYDVRYYDDNDFDRLTIKIALYEDLINNLNKKINIINISKDQDLNNFKLPYFKFKVFQHTDDKGIVKRGYYRFHDVLGKFKEANGKDLQELQLKREKEIRISMNKTFNGSSGSIDIKNTDEKEFKKFITKLRNYRTHNIVVLPKLNDTHFESSLVKSRMKFILDHNIDLKFEGSEGSGKSSLARFMAKKFYEEGIRKDYLNSKKTFNFKRVWKLTGLCVAYSFLATILLTVAALIDTGLYVVLNGINIIILWEVFIKPIFKEFLR